MNAWPYPNWLKTPFKSIILQIDVTQTTDQGGLLAVFNQLLGDVTTDYFYLMLEFHNDKSACCLLLSLAAK